MSLDAGVVTDMIVYTGQCLYSYAVIMRECSNGSTQNDFCILSHLPSKKFLPASSNKIVFMAQCTETRVIFNVNACCSCIYISGRINHDKS